MGRSLRSLIAALASLRRYGYAISVEGIEAGEELCSEVGPVGDRSDVGRRYRNWLAGAHVVRGARPAA